MQFASAPSKGAQKPTVPHMEVEGNAQRGAGDCGRKQEVRSAFRRADLHDGPRRLAVCKSEEARDLAPNLVRRKDQTRQIVEGVGRRRLTEEPGQALAPP